MTAKWSKVRVTLAGRDGPVEVDGQVNPAFPGLAIHKRLGHSKYWAVSHMASGRGFGIVASQRKTAREIVERIGPLGDWTADYVGLMSAFSRSDDRAKIVEALRPYR